ncbi:MAG: KamA family radical SAM protein [Candidatus Omnitrophica bacterium]|nr:KamA family radical SAM protein [Candidatus Omnitrophota bacterium]
MWAVEPEVKNILLRSSSLKEARTGLFNYINNAERALFKAHSKKPLKQIHPVEKNNAKECIRVFKNIIRAENEHLTGFSALNLLWKLAVKPEEAQEHAGEGFILELLYIFKGIKGQSELYDKKAGERAIKETEKAGLIRSQVLDKYSSLINSSIQKYSSGLDESLVRKREGNKKRIMSYLKAEEKDWQNYRWHLKHIFQELRPLKELINLEKDELEGLECAQKAAIPFQITPYYLSLFNPEGRTGEDRTVRAQVIPSVNYCRTILESREKGQDMDFMGEKSTSPIDCITRRYPQILIIKPFDSCPQICVYCQRNWEIKNIGKGAVTGNKVQKALDWIRRNPNITEVLVTGGDPLTLNNDYLVKLMESLSSMPHIERIRIGTRTPVTLPFRINPGFISMLKKYHQWGTREVCIVTHVEHSSEITPDVLEAIKKIKETGTNVYNQQVFTYYNSRRFETAALRRALKISGIDPYYSFNTKGKAETADFRVPIARIEQERKEEARLLPGMVRMDEPVFNVPKLGKSYLRAWQDHEVIMLLPDGRRVYRFYPWESRILLTDTYLYTDVSIYDYLIRLHNDGESTADYKSIWYYF